MFDVVVNSTLVRQRGPGTAVGEMAAVNPIQRRSATIRAVTDSLVAKITEAQLS
ncbi:cyclic nucleotide-binding domain-containing protein [Caballeronia sp. GaOx3]|uniref:cyclic nucleotide-binding domain-containing protein n=1 Tax=Caballeronia sp. GaOx3 TaxID=2921740 RepID=UPI0020294C0E|nr:cyclic nucleotide-binding domain-containing protein [Caballeronia sp. GaOx3]